MRFLLEANRMSRGYARIRQWLILLFRVLAIAGLVFMISRPLASGLAGPCRRRPAGHDAHPARPLAQHEAARRRERSSKLETGVEQLVHRRSRRSARRGGC